MLYDADNKSLDSILILLLDIGILKVPLKKKCVPILYFAEYVLGKYEERAA